MNIDNFSKNGLQRCGDTCYMNATLRCLHSIKVIKDALLD